MGPREIPASLTNQHRKVIKDQDQRKPRNNSKTANQSEYPTQPRTPRKTRTNTKVGVSPS